MDRELTKAGSRIPGGGKYLNICLGPEAFCLPVLQVREIIRLRPVTPVPRMPGCIKGVINLRGKIVPVMDLRERLELPPADYGEQACIVILQTDKSGNFGLIVDRVEDVSPVSEDDIELPPGLGLGVKVEFMTGIANAKEGVKIILNVQRLVDLDTALKFLEDVP
jgi:purine-binding chemotaxis protein CheW